jgi:hypothetical protein
MQARMEQEVLAVTAFSQGAAFLTSHGYSTLAFPTDKPGASAGQLLAPVDHGCEGLEEGLQLVAAAWAPDANGMLWRRRVRQHASVWSSYQ